MSMPPPPPSARRAAATLPFGAPGADRISPPPPPPRRPGSTGDAASIEVSVEIENDTETESQLEGGTSASASGAAEHEAEAPTERGSTPPALIAATVPARDAGEPVLDAQGAASPSEPSPERPVVVEFAVVVESDTLPKPPAVDAAPEVPAPAATLPSELPPTRAASLEGTTDPDVVPVPELPVPQIADAAGPLSVDSFWSKIPAAPPQEGAAAELAPEARAALPVPPGFLRAAPPPPPPTRRASPVPPPPSRVFAGAPSGAFPNAPAGSFPAPPKDPASLVPFGGAGDDERDDTVVTFKEQPTNPVASEAMASIVAASESEEGNELGRDDLTRPLPGTLLLGPTASDFDVTRPLPPTESKGSTAFGDGIAPYGGGSGDTDLTRPFVPGASPLRPSGMVVIPPAPMPPPGATSDVPLIVAVPPPSVGSVEQSPSIQIAGSRSVSATSPGTFRAGAAQTMPRIPPPAPVPSDFAPRGASPSFSPVSGSNFPPAVGRLANNKWFVAGIAALVSAAAFGVVMRPRSGSLVVTVSGPSGGRVDGVSVTIDGKERCTATPCEIADLQAGTHLVSASASGFPQSADRAVAVEAGEHSAQHVSLAAAERAHSGLSVSASGGRDLRVFVDGRDVGAPPISLDDVTPGRHVVRVQGPERLYEPYEESVKLESGEVRSLGPIRLRVLRGRLELRAGAGAQGAHVAVDGKPVGRLPASLELSADDSHEVTAQRPGFAPFTEQVVFDGTAERTLDVTLDSAGGGSAPVSSPGPVRMASVAANVRPGAAKATKAAPAAAAAARATTGVAVLDINSTPRANVVVNGRPLGATPLRGIRVEPGRQTIVFVHPTLGRKVASANVSPGAHQSVGVKF